MGEEFHAIVKLVSGEELLSLIFIDENNGDPVVVMQNPVTMKIVNNRYGMQIKVKPWMEMSNDDFFIVKPDKIITMTETKDIRLITIFDNYVKEDLENERTEVSTGKVKPSSDMGYVTSVEKAREILEKLYKLKDTKES
jgi:hypothetical protein